MQQRLLEEERLRLQLENTLHPMELKVLQAKMNPHFLFNTLTALRSFGALYNSKGHRENMLAREYKYLGVGVAFQMDETRITGTLYLTQNFCH